MRNSSFNRQKPGTKGILYKTWHIMLKEGKKGARQEGERREGGQKRKGEERAT